MNTGLPLFPLGSLFNHDLLSKRTVVPLTKKLVSSSLKAIEESQSLN